MVNGPGPAPCCAIQAFQLTCLRFIQCPGEVLTWTEATALPVLITMRASQYRDDPGFTKNARGPGSAGFLMVWYETLMSPAFSGASLANAGKLRSMCPALHSGHWSITSTRTLPCGPVTSR